MAWEMSPNADRVKIGIIGMGLMGKMYAQRISQAGWSVNACDREENFAQLENEFRDFHNIKVYRNGYLVSRSSDLIIYSVEAENIDKIVALYGPSTKQGAIVGGQTSCKTPEIAAFERHLPSDVEIVTCHSMHGPKVDPKDQPLAIIKHRASDRSVNLVKKVLSCFESREVELTAEEHDTITADTQAVTHAAFLSMGTAWKANNQFPWAVPRYVGGIENVKANLTLRIYSNKWHVYAGLAILNPSAKLQITQYAASATALFNLMISGQREELEKRIKTAGNAVFAGRVDRDLLLKDEILDRFSLGKKPLTRTPNNHLSLLAMVDCWWKLGIVPYRHLICSTPLFRLWLGVTEYLFHSPSLLDEVINTAISDLTFREEDLEFTIAARGWAECVESGIFGLYQKRFQGIQSYFEGMFEDATKVGNEMIATIERNMR